MLSLRLALLLVCVASLACKRTEPLRPMKALPLTEGSAHNARAPLGTNLTALSDFSTEWAFVDAFKTSRPWISSSEGTWDTKQPLDLDDNGWVRSLRPGQWARTLVLWDLPTTAVPKGDYVVTWTGKGVLETWPRAPVAAEPGRLVVRVDGGDKAGISLIIKETDPADPIRDIHVWLPGFADVEPKPLFHPAFLESVRAYKVLRFMDWMATNDSQATTWDARPRLEHARWDRGAPVEVIAALANTLKADPWINVPHRADDAYVEGLARALFERLDKERVVFVEHSNEVWNGQFEQARHALAEGRRLGLAKADHEAQLKWHAQRSVHVFGVFERVFGGTDRLVRVMASQAASAWASRVLLEHGDAWRSTDALAVAPYFGGDLGEPSQQAKVAAMSLDDLMATLAGPSLDAVRRWLKEQAVIARRFGTPLIAYEGGQHLVGVGPPRDDAAINALFDAANSDPRMKDVYAAYLKAWRDAGGQLFVHFVNTTAPSKFGRWGARETLLQPPKDAPKLDALQAFSAQNPAWWHAP